MTLVTIVTVNFKTPDLIRDCLDSVMRYYPDLPLIAIDNGGCRASCETLREFKDKHPRMTLLENHRNLGHGPALNQGMALVRTPFAFLLDSDTKILSTGFIGKMVKLCQPDVLAVGWLRYVSHASGVAHPDQDAKQGLEYIHPHACLMSVERFKECRPFTHSGAPALQLMLSAKAQEMRMVNFPVEQYVWHKIAGTRGLFDGWFKPTTDAKPGQWKKRAI